MTDINHKIKDEEIVVSIMLPHCSVCGKALADIDVEEHHFEMALKEYRNRKMLLMPEEIKMIREYYGLSQRAFARALGFAEPTINRYEFGAIQDIVHNNIMLLVKEPKNMLLIATQNRKNLSSKEYELIISKAQNIEPREDESTENLVNILAEKISSLEVALRDGFESVNKKLEAFNAKQKEYKQCTFLKSKWAFDYYNEQKEDLQPNQKYDILPC
jgi:putative zinc finger/helix-turn-helix YgiT family protein